jgi:hypothetical protein
MNAFLLDFLTHCGTPSSLLLRIIGILEDGHPPKATKSFLAARRIPFSFHPFRQSKIQN